MARVAKVTRTITTSSISVLAMDIVKGEVVKDTHLIIGSRQNNETTLKELKKIFDTDTVKIVTIQSINETTGLYGMTEEHFLANAELLPPR